MRVVLLILFGMAFSAVAVPLPSEDTTSLGEDDGESTCSTEPPLEVQNLIQGSDCSFENPIVPGCPKLWNSSRVENIELDSFGPIANHRQQQHYLIDFDAYWCLHSLRFRKTFEEIAERLSVRGDIRVVHVDVDKAKELRERLGIKSYPAVALWKKGGPLFQNYSLFNGKRNRVNLMSWIEYMAPSSDARLGPIQPIPQPQTCDVDKITDSDQTVNCSSKAVHLGAQELLQRTETLWSFKEGRNVFVGPADNSNEKEIAEATTPAEQVVLSNFTSAIEVEPYSAVYFYSPRCKYCACLDQIWDKVNHHLVSEGHQSDLQMLSLNGDSSPALLHRFNVTKYPTFLLFKGRSVISRFPSNGQRRSFDISTWIQDGIVSNENHIVQHRFTTKENPSQSSSPSPSTTPSVSPSTSPSPSPSMTCPPNENEFMTALTGRDCEGSEKKFQFCSSLREGGKLIRQLCPHTCQSCPDSLNDNDVLVQLIFQKACVDYQITECTCQGMYAGPLALCTPESADPMSKYLASLCPTTCGGWRVIHQNDDTLNFKNSYVSHAQARATVSSTVCLEDPNAEPEAKNEGETTNTMGAMLSYRLTFLEGILAKLHKSVSAKTVPKQPTFVFFYDPNCPLGRNLAMEWTRLSEQTDVQEYSLIAINSDIDGEILKQMGVKATPMVGYFPPDQPMVALSEIRRYVGQNNRESVLNWMHTMVEQSLF